MCRIGAIKSSEYFHPSKTLELMRSQQKGHDNSGFAFVMKDLGGIFEGYKDLPLLSMACTDKGVRIAEDILHSIGFTRLFQWTPDIDKNLKGLQICPMPNYVFCVFNYPKLYKYATKEDKEELLLDTRLKLRYALEENDEGYIYSFCLDILMLQEIGNPKDIGTYFNLH